MKNKNKATLILCILLPLAVGSLSALFSQSAMSSYQSLNKPPFNPPAILFPVVWTILYILMGISSYLIVTSNSPQKDKALKTYLVQLVFNFCWSIIFFTFSRYLFAFLWLIALIVLIVLMIYQFRQIRPVAAGLQIPYLLWCLFAAYLNLAIVLLN